MLETLGDIAVHFCGDAAGETWYLGRVMGIQDKPYKRWQNRHAPVPLDVAGTVRVRCQWYLRAKATKDADGKSSRCVFHLGNHPTDPELCAPVDDTWYEGSAVLGLVTATFVEGSSNTFTVEQEMCDYFDVQSTSSSKQPDPTADKNKNKKKKQTSAQSDAVHGPRRPAKDVEGRASRAAKRAKTGNEAGAAASGTRSDNEVPPAVLPTPDTESTSETRKRQGDSEAINCEEISKRKKDD